VNGCLAFQGNAFRDNDHLSLALSRTVPFGFRPVRAESQGKLPGSSLCFLTVLLVVRDVPALLNELSAAVVTWLPAKSNDVAADALCSAPYRA